jgi:hypothetical protein
MNLQTLTFVHVVISLVAIASGFVVVFGLLKGKRLDGWTALFLSTTVATSVTGFFFPFTQFTPALAFGIISLVVLAAVIPARYTMQLAGHWRWIYVVGAVFSLYLNFFVLIVQAFQKIPALHALAPTQSEMPFLITQLIALVLFITLGILTTIRFRVAQPERLAGSQS